MNNTINNQVKCEIKDGQLHLYITQKIYEQMGVNFMLHILSEENINKKERNAFDEIDEIRELIKSSNNKLFSMCKSLRQSVKK
jgi:hypothetical protein